jgi:AI-2E family transporter
MSAPLLWALWVALVDFLPMVGDALAGIPTVLFALSQSLTAGIVTAAAFIAYQQLENHVLNPVVMSRTVNVNPLLVLLSLLVGTSIGDWIGGPFRQFCRGAAFHPGRGRSPGHQPGNMAGYRVGGIARQRTARRTGARGTRRASTGDRSRGFVTASRNRPEWS